MKYILTLIYTLITYASCAQTIDNSWFYPTGVSYDHVVNFDDSNALIEEPQFGLDQVWDFSQIAETPFIDEISFRMTDASGFSETYPEANVLKRVTNQFNDWFWYYRVEQDTIFEEGFTVISTIGDPDTTQLIRATDEQIYAIDGFTVGDSLWTSNQFYIQHILVGTGRVITPDSTFDNCILMKEDAPGVGTDAFTYRWFHVNLSREVLSFVPDESDHPFPVVSYMRNYEGPITSALDETSDLASIKVRLINKQAFIDNPTERMSVKMLIYSMTGALVYNNDVVLESGKNIIDVNGLENLPTGTYPMLLIEKGSGSFSTHRLILID